MKKKNTYLLIAIALLSAVSFGMPAMAQEAAGNEVNNQTENDTKDRKTIEGLVFDQSTGKPIFGATIKMEKISVYTNEEGVFSMKLPKNPSNSIVISAPGYDGRNIELRGRTNFRIALVDAQFAAPKGTKPQAKLSDELLVHDAAAAMTLEDISIIKPMETIESLIQSEMGTVYTQNRSGMPGIGASLFIRGFNSLNSNAQPLFVVDGVVLDNYYDVTSIHDGFYSNPLGHIDLKDVESITVVKDAASIYGSRAANGVVLIDTKTSQTNVTRILANVTAGVTTQPQTYAPVLDADQHRLLVSELYRDHPDYRASDLDQMDIFNDNPEYVYYNKNHNNTSWRDWIFRDAFNQNYSVVATGGDDVGKYSLAVGYLANEGTMEKTKQTRLNTRFNSDITIAKNLLLHAKFDLSDLSYDVMGDGMLAKNSLANIAMIKSPMFYPYTYARASGLVTTTPENADYFAVSNPEGLMIQSEKMLSKASHFTAVGVPEWTINEHWKMTGLFDYTINKNYESYFTPQAIVAPEPVLSFTGATGDKLNELKVQNMRDMRYDFDVRLRYNTKIGYHHLTATGGYRYSKAERILDFGKGYNNNSSDDLTKALLYKEIDGDYRDVRRISWYLNANWNYASKYYLALTSSIDASSRFGENVTGNAFRLFNTTWGVFPSVSAYWLLSSEDFMAGFEALNLWKIRASYGLTGNDDIPDYVSSTYFGSVNYVEKGTGLVLYNLGNDKLQWETTAKANVGMDISLFDDRLSLSGDFYSNKTSDLLVLKQFDTPLSGFRTYWSNDGELSNKGYELSANLRLLNVGSFRWEAAAAIAHNQNKVTRLADGDYTSSVNNAEILTSVGNPIGLFWGYKTNGVYASREDASTAYNRPDGTKDYLYNENENTTLTPFEAGDVRFVDKDGNGIINDKDKDVIGNPNPDYTGMFSTTIGYKGLNLTALFTYSYGNDIYNYSRYRMESMSNFDNQTTASLNRWRYEGHQTDMPKAVWGDPMGNARFSDRWIEDGSYLRFKSLTLSWKLPYKIPYLQALTVWGSATNLATWTHYLGADPENSAYNEALYQGIDIGLLPQSLSYTIGLRINL